MRPVILLMGPTASGKTALAVRLVERLPLEIVSVDSGQVYRGLDIGTAKPPPEVLARAPHRLVDLLDPAESYSAGLFRRDAIAAIRDIHAAGRVPLLTGGTMLYFRALERGLADLPCADPASRAAIDAEADARGWTALHADLARIDPRAAARIHPNDARRIQRALEVFRLTGRPLSELQRGTRAPGDLRFVKLAVAPASRQALRERIAGRYADMLAQGFVAEVERLHSRGDLHGDLPSTRAVGYRQIWQSLEGHCTREQALAGALVATQNLARRQMTWLRAQPDIDWHDALEPDLGTHILRRVQGVLDGTA